MIYIVTRLFNQSVTSREEVRELAPEKKYTQAVAESPLEKKTDSEVALRGLDSFFDQKDNKKIVVLVLYIF
jgi:hypothetical protein